MPSAYAQTAGPNGVTQVGDRARATRTASEAPARPTRPARPGRRGGPARRPRDPGRSCRGGSPRRARGAGSATRRRGRRSRQARIASDGGEEHDPEQLGAEARARRSRRRSRPGRGAPPDRAGSQRSAPTVDEPDGGRDQDRPQHDEPAPARRALDEAANRTPAPHCWLSHGSPNAVNVKGSVAQDRQRAEHQLAGPHLVGEVDRGHRGDRRREGGQEDREGEPESVAVMSASGYATGPTAALPGHRRPAAVSSPAADLRRSGPRGRPRRRSPRPRRP